MTPITRYQADDGAEFATESDCLAYEGMIAEITKIVARLNPPPFVPDHQFNERTAFVQQDKYAVDEVKKSLLDFAKRRCPHWDNSTIYDAWMRLQSIDGQGREWIMPYYATLANREVAA